MVEALILKAQKRQRKGTRAARKERAAGVVPVIIYGHREEPIAAHIDYHDLALELQHHHRLLHVELQGQKLELLVKDVQYDHLGEKLIHTDLMRVSLDERVEITVAVELRGTPAGAADGGVLDQMADGIELECLVSNIPESIRASVINMKVGDTLLARDLPLPEGTRLVTDPQTPIAAVRLVAEEPEEEVLEEEKPGEPEVITAREKPEEQSEEPKGESRSGKE